MVRGVEDLRTPLSEIIALDKKMRGTLSGFMMPSFVIDLPGGGGKRLVSTKESYDEATGEATYTAPGLPGTKGLKEYKYKDPRPFTKSELLELRTQREKAREMSKLLDNAGKQVDEEPVVSTQLANTPLRETLAAEKSEVAQQVVDTPPIKEPVIQTPVVKEPTVEAPKIHKPARQDKSEPLPMPALHWDAGRTQKERASLTTWVYPEAMPPPDSATQSFQLIVGSKDRPW